jgi:hypothetical protein
MTSKYTWICLNLYADTYQRLGCFPMVWNVRERILVVQKSTLKLIPYYLNMFVASAVQVSCGLLIVFQRILSRNDKNNESYLSRLPLWMIGFQFIILCLGIGLIVVHSVVTRCPEEVSHIWKYLRRIERLIRKCKEIKIVTVLHN